MIIRADARRLPLRDRCVQTCVTSPPYFGLRDYGHAQQIGLETDPSAYVAALVIVFAEIRRVLQDDGTVWVNLGDSYAGGNQTGRNDNGRPEKDRGWAEYDITRTKVARTDGAKAKDLLGIPWRVAFALQADGWYLRSDIIWSKPNPMPESVTDRPTKAHEYLFLLAKSERYYYDAEAIREPNTVGTLERLASGPVQAKAVQPKNLLGRRDSNIRPYTGQRIHFDGKKGLLPKSSVPGRSTQSDRCGDNADGRNKRSVWTIPTWCRRQNRD